MKSIFPRLYSYRSLHISPLYPALPTQKSVYLCALSSTYACHHYFAHKYIWCDCITISVCVCICELCLNARSIVYLHCTSYPSHRHNNLLMSVLQSPILNQNLFNYRLGSDVFVRIYVWVPYRQRFFLLFSCCCCYCCLCCALCMVWGSTPGRHHQPPSKGDNRNAYVRSTFSIYCVQINNVDASRWVNRNGSK